MHRTTVGFGRIIEKDTDEIERRWKTMEEKILNLIEKEDENERQQASLQSTGSTSSKISVHVCVWSLPSHILAALFSLD